MHNTAGKSYGKEVWCRSGQDELGRPRWWEVTRAGAEGVFVHAATCAI